MHTVSRLEEGTVGCLFGLLFRLYLYIDFLDNRVESGGSDAAASQLPRALCLEMGLLNIVLILLEVQGTVGDRRGPVLSVLVDGSPNGRR